MQRLGRLYPHRLHGGEADARQHHHTHEQESGQRDDDEAEGRSISLFGHGGTRHHDIAADEQCRKGSQGQQQDAFAQQQSENLLATAPHRHAQATNEEIDRLV